MAAVRVTALGFVHRMWKRMSGPTGAQSTTLSVGTGGGGGGANEQLVAQTSIVPSAPAQVKTSLGNTSDRGRSGRHRDAQVSRPTGGHRIRRRRQVVVHQRRG